jgi:hypothetical protein
MTSILTMPIMASMGDMPDAAWNVMSLCSCHLFLQLIGQRFTNFCAFQPRGRFAFDKKGKIFRGKL